MKKNGVNSVTRKCSGVSTIQLREKAIVESPTYDLAASAAFSTSGIDIYFALLLSRNDGFGIHTFLISRHNRFPHNSGELLPSDS